MAVKFFPIAIALLVGMFAAPSLLIAGGTSDFAYDCDDQGNLTVWNTSFGLFTDVSWNVKDYSGNVIGTESPSDKSTSWTSDGPNVFKVTMSIQTYAGVTKRVTKDVVMEGEREYDITYTLDTVPIETITITVSVHTSDFLRYKNENIDRAPGLSVSTALVKRYVESIETSNNAVENIVGQLVEAVPEGDDEFYTNSVLAFVQNLTYVSDIRSTGQSEYWKFPVETLFTNAGDCEDTSMLVMILFKMFFMEKEGKDVSTALVIFWGEGHAMAAISLDPGPVTSPYGSVNARSQDTSITGYVVDSMTYYLCETTATKWKVGWAPYGSNSTSTNIFGATPDHLLIV